MRVVVLDASALVELVIDGRHRDGAERLLDEIAGPAPPELVTAAHGLVEALSALRRLEAAGVIDAGPAAAAVEHLGRLDPAVDPTGPRRQRIWALRGAMSAYDAAYAAVAEALRAPLVTVDVRLVRACAAAGIAASHLDDRAA